MSPPNGDAHGSPDPHGMAKKREKLRLYYLQRLVGKRQEVRNWIGRLQSGTVADAQRDGLGERALAELRDYAHGIAGAAGSFGFTDIGLAAGELERAPEDALAERAQALLERIEAALGTDSRLRSPPSSE